MGKTQWWIYADTGNHGATSKYDCQAAKHTSDIQFPERERVIHINQPVHPLVEYLWHPLTHSPHLGSTHHMTMLRWLVLECFQVLGGLQLGPKHGNNHSIDPDKLGYQPCNIVFCFTTLDYSHSFRMLPGWYSHGWFNMIPPPLEPLEPQLGIRKKNTVSH